MIEKVTNTIKVFKRMDMEQITTYKYLVFILVIGTVFGVWWYLEWRKLASAMLIVELIFLGLLLALEKSYKETPVERRYKGNMEQIFDDNQEEKDKPTESEEKEQKDEGIGLNLGDMGLDPDDYNERLEKATGLGF